jgi:site-specific DNA recombinase
LLQGLLSCSECRYAYYGKTTRQRGAGGRLRDFTYYRCSGTDGYRFGGERICDNSQIRGEFIEASVWAEVCRLLKSPQRLEQEHQQRLAVGRSPEDLQTLKAQLGKLQRGMERLIDSYSEGVIDKEQFTPRLSRTKSRIAELETRIHSSGEGADGRQALRSLVEQFQRLAVHLGRGLEDADWNRRREVIRSLVERIEIGRANIAIAFRVPHDIAVSTKDPIMVTLSRA